MLHVEAKSNLNNWSALKWQPLPDSNCADCMAQTWMPLKTQYYTVQITDNYGCTAQASMLVRVTREVDIYIPNVFSPDGDGENDWFTLSTGPSVELDNLYIFDRWGNLIYAWETPVSANQWPGWDGSSRGQKVDLGVYVYYLTLRLLDGQTLVKSGDVTVVRR